MACWPREVVVFVKVISTEDQTSPKFGQHAVVVSLLKLAMRVQRGREEPFLLAMRALSTAWNHRGIWDVGMMG